jgi:hypothetical protein
MHSYFWTVAPQATTRGRRKRRRLPGAGTSVTVKPHVRSPRGPNAGKSSVRVDGYKRGKPPKKRGKKRKR